MRVKWQSQNSKKNMVVFKRLVEENPDASFQKLAELMTLNGSVSKSGRPMSYGAVQWMWKKLHRKAKSKAKPELYYAPAVPKTTPKAGDKMDLITLVMAANIPDHAKLDVVKVLANVP